MKEDPKKSDGQTAHKDPAENDGFLLFWGYLARNALLKVKEFLEAEYFETRLHEAGERGEYKGVYPSLAEYTTEYIYEIQFPVAWDWINISLSARTLSDETIYVGDFDRRLEEAFDEADELARLHVITSGGRLLKRKNTYHYLMDWPKYNDLKKQELEVDEAQAFLTLHHAPNTFYAPPSKWTPEELRIRKFQDTQDFTFLSIENTEDLFKEYVEECGGRFHHRNKDGSTVDLYMVIHPLLVNEDTRRAYFPITAGLIFEEGQQGTLTIEAKRCLFARLFRRLLLTIEAMLSDEYKAGRSTPNLDPKLIIWKPEHFPLTRYEEWEEKEFPSKAKDRTRWEKATFNKDHPGHESNAETFDPDLWPDADLGPLEPYVAENPTPGLRVFPIAFTQTRSDRWAMDIVHTVHKVNLPNKWSTIPRWENLVDKEIKRILAAEGEDSASLKISHRSKDNKKIIKLTAETERRLRRDNSGKAIISTDRFGKECLTMYKGVGNKGTLEIGLSWGGQAAPLVSGWRQESIEEVEHTQDILNKAKNSLVPYQPEDHERVDRAMRRLHLYEFGASVMEVILGQVGAQYSSQVIIPAEALREALWNKDRPKNWKQTVDEILNTLMTLTFTLKTNSSNYSLNGEGVFISYYEYKGRGAGSHGDGYYYIKVTPEFLPSMKCFATDTDEGTVKYDFNSPNLPPKALKKFFKENPYQMTDTGLVFYSRAANFTPHQHKLYSFIENNLTLKKHTARKGNKAAKVDVTHPEANERRTYGPRFCPLLPSSREYFGALSNFKSRAAETGIGLLSTSSAPSRHTGGLAEKMGYKLPAGRATKKRRNVIKKMIGDLNRVVVEVLGGVVAGRIDNKWFPLSEFESLSHVYLKKLRVYCFVATDYKPRLDTLFEKTKGYRVTHDPKDSLVWDSQTIPEEAEGVATLPLYNRLYGEMKNRKLKQKDLATIFDVTPKTVSLWMKGPEGKPISAELIPYVERWIKTGQAPSKTELAARKTRRTGK